MGTTERAAIICQQNKNLQCKQLGCLASFTSSTDHLAAHQAELKLVEVSSFAQVSEESGAVARGLKNCLSFALSRYFLTPSCFPF